MPIDSMSGGTFSVPAFGTTEVAPAPKVEDIMWRPYAPATTSRLTKAVAVHNAKHGKSKGKGATLAAVRQVYRRGFADGGADKGWARVHGHLVMLAHGMPPQGHVPDNDLLPKGHPLKEGKRRSGVKALIATRVAAGVFSTEVKAMDPDSPYDGTAAGPDYWGDGQPIEVDGPSFDELEAADEEPPAGTTPDDEDPDGLPDGATPVDEITRPHDVPGPLDDGYDGAKQLPHRPVPAAMYTTESKAQGVPALGWPTSPEVPADVAVERKVGGQTLSIDDDDLVWAIVNVTGVADQVGDITLPGCFDRSLTLRIPKGIWSHDWMRWVSRTEEVHELRPGDSSLPATTRQGDPWPRAAGAMLVATRYNTDTQEGHDALSNVKFFDSGPLGPQCEYSIGYHVPSGQAFRDKQGIRNIKMLDWWEYGPTLFGAAPLVGTMATKARQSRSLTLT